MQAGDIRDLWRNRDYMLLWSGESISDLGTGISQVAFPVLILILTNSPALAGLMFAAGQLPYVLFSLLAGALADRWERKRIMLCCTAGLAICLASVALVVLAGLPTSLQILLFFVLTFLIGMLSVFYGLASLASLTRVVPKEMLPLALSQNEAVYSSVSLAAPPIGTFLLNFNRLLPFVADAISYVVLFVALFFMHSSLQEQRVVRKTPILRDIREGLSWVWRHHVVRLLILLAGYLEIMVRVNVLFVPVIARNERLPLSQVGVILAAVGIGNILGVMASPVLQRRVPLGRLLAAALCLFILLWPLYGVVKTPWSLGLLLAALGCIDSIAYQNIISYRLSLVPDQLQGRVSSVARLIFFSCITLGPAAAGASLQRFGVVPTVGCMWVGFILCALLVLLNRQLRQAALVGK